MYCNDTCEQKNKRTKKPKYMNQFCKIECIIKNKLTCKCGEIGIFDWHWELPGNNYVEFSENNTNILFHPIFSSGTALLIGSQLLKVDYHHFWEIKVNSKLYGTDVMVGVGTSKLRSNEWKYGFFSILGQNEESYGYSYTGIIQHNNQRIVYGSKFNLGSLVGVHLDMFTGTLEFYLNKKPLGIAFTGLKSKKLYPMISSTAAQSAVKMTYAISVPSSLQTRCMKIIMKNPDILKKLESIPGLYRFYKDRYIWAKPYENTVD